MKKIMKFNCHKNASQKFKATTFLAITLLLSIVCKAQGYFPFKNENGKVGIKVKRTYYGDPEILVQPKYDSIKICDENCILETNENGSYEVKDYGTGLIQVILNGKVGLINNNGAEIVPPKYDAIGACGYSCGEPTVMGNVDEYGNIVEETHVGINRKNNYFLDPSYIIKVGLNKKVGGIDLSGNEVIQPIYDEINFQSSDVGFFEARINNKAGIIDINGKVKISLKYDDIKFIGEVPNFALAKLNGKWNFIDSSEKQINISSITDSIINTDSILFFKKILHKYNGELNYLDSSQKQIKIIFITDSAINGHFCVLNKLSNNILYDRNILINMSEKSIVAVYDEINNYDDVLFVKRKGKFGMIDTNGNEIIPPNLYNSINDFNDGLALVVIGDSLPLNQYWPWDDCYCTKINKKCGVGFIDKTGREVIPLIYNAAKSFNKGKAEVKLNNKWGIINTKGDFIIPAIYDTIGIFFENCLFVKLNRKYGVIDTLGNELTSIKYDWIGESENRYFVFRFENRFTKVFNGAILPGTYDYIKGYEVQPKGKWGMINNKGKEIISVKYDEIDYLSKGFIKVQLNNKWGLTDTIGKEIIPIKYDYIIVDFPQNGFIKVQLNNKWGLTDTIGNEIIPTKYDYIDYPQNGLIKVQLNNKWGCIDKIGKVIIPLRYNEIGNFFQDLLNVKLNQKWGFIDKTGKEVISLKYSEAGSFYEGMAAVKLNNKWGFIDKTGKEVISLKYSEAGSFYEGMAAVKLNNKWGFIDKTGKVIIYMKYDNSSPPRFENGKASVNEGGRWLYIDKNGNEIKN